MPKTYEPIASWTATDSLSTSVDFQNLSQNYTDLSIAIKMCAVGALNETGTLRCRFNNDTGSNYALSIMYSYDSTVAGATSNAVTYVQVGYVPKTTSNTNKFALLTYNIFNYTNTNLFKATTSMSNFTFITNTAGEDRISAWTNTWRSTSAINRLTFEHDGGNQLRAGSSIVIYGVKSA